MSNPNATVDRNVYGSVETNGLVNGREYHEQFSRTDKVYWNHPGLRITRLRLISDRGYPAWDVSYCHGYVGDRPVHVELPFSDLPKGNVTGAIIEYAKRDKVYAKGIGILGAISVLI